MPPGWPMGGHVMGMGDRAEDGSLTWVRGLWMETRQAVKTTSCGECDGDHEGRGLWHGEGTAVGPGLTLYVAMLSPETRPKWAEAYAEPKCREEEEVGKKRRYAMQGSYQNRGGFDLTNAFWVSLPWSCAQVVSNLVTEERGRHMAVSSKEDHNKEAKMKEPGVLSLRSNLRKLLKMMRWDSTVIRGSLWKQDSNLSTIPS